jgi:hypothetical protein
MSLTEKDIAIAKGMLLRGDDQHHIAALFGENAGRIAEISNGMKPPNGEIHRVERGRDINPAPADELPPPGPYFLNILAPRDIILVALEDSLEPMALYIEGIDPRDTDHLMQTKATLARLRTALAERRRELWKGRGV